jgi:calcineurin-like phosphoesterase family protein
MSTVFVTSNQQFGRPSAIKKFKRPFESVEEMNKVLIEAWNSVVKKEDIVYVLGNFGWDPETTEECINKLNGRVHLLLGEEDAAAIEISELSDTTDKLTISDKQIDVYQKSGIVFSYWPLEEWPKRRKGYINAFGYPSNKFKTDHKKGVINVNCDSWNFKPVRLSKLIALFQEIENN